MADIVRGKQSILHAAAQDQETRVFTEVERSWCVRSWAAIAGVPVDVISRALAIL